MKISKILLFILGVLLGLAALCLLVPAEGITLGGVTLEFPSLAYVLDAEEKEGGEESVEESLTPEELLELRMSNLQTQKEDEFRQFTQSSPSRIYLPQGNEAYLDPFFQALQQAGTQAMRILHFGDSQLECDRISSSLREHYQSEFGGHGVGLVPAYQTVPTYTTSQWLSVDSVARHLAYGPGKMRGNNSRYGIMGQVCHVPSGVTITLSARDVKTYPHSGQIARVTVLARGNGGISLRADTTSLRLTAENVNDTYTRLTAQLPRPVRSLTLTTHGAYDIYGIQLDDTHGVAVDNVPMRGCSGTIFTGISESTFAPFFRDENVRLILLQYGGNSVPGTTTSYGISAYMTKLRSQIRLFRRLAPQSSILFIGPADMATRLHGQMATYEILPEMVDSLRQMSLQEGIAFWDMYAAMGGKGSIVEWHKAVPQLAGSDYVHFTPKGAEKMADMLYGTLQLYYRFYRLRTGQERESMLHELQADTTAAQEQKPTLR